MKAVVLTSLKIVGVSLLGIALIYVIWQPVFPSGFIVRKMAETIEPETLALDQPKVIRFQLSGKGGGIYNIVAAPDKVAVVEGRMDRADLILYMEAKDFNELMFSLALGKADEYTFRKRVIDKTMRFAGDLGVMEMLLQQPDS